MLIVKRHKLDIDVGCGRNRTHREVTDEQQAVVWVPTPSVYFHITSINHRGEEPVREIEREKIDTLMCL